MIKENLREKIHDALQGALGDAMDCTRVWDAWRYGTMSEDDFSVITEDDERMKELVDAVMSVLADLSIHSGE